MKPIHELAIIVTGKNGTHVYQRVGKGRGNISRPGRHDLQLRQHVIPTDYKTAPQIACRQRLAAATLAWQELQPENKEEWRKKAKHRKATGFNLFVKDYCRTHPL